MSSSSSSSITAQLAAEEEKHRDFLTKFTSNELWKIKKPREQTKVLKSIQSLEKYLKQNTTFVITTHTALHSTFAIHPYTCECIAQFYQTINNVEKESLWLRFAIQGWRNQSLQGEYENLDGFNSFQQSDRDRLLIVYMTTKNPQILLNLIAAYATPTHSEKESLITFNLNLPFSPFTEFNNLASTNPNIIYNFLFRENFSEQVLQNILDCLTKENYQNLQLVLAIVLLHHMAEAGMPLDLVIIMSHYVSLDEPIQKEIYKPKQIIQTFAQTILDDINSFNPSKSKFSIDNIKKLVEKMVLDPTLEDVKQLKILISQIPTDYHFKFLHGKSINFKNKWLKEYEQLPINNFPTFEIKPLSIKK